MLVRCTNYQVSLTSTMFAAPLHWYEMVISTNVLVQKMFAAAPCLYSFPFSYERAEKRRNVFFKTEAKLKKEKNTPIQLKLIPNNNISNLIGPPHF